MPAPRSSPRCPPTRARCEPDAHERRACSARSSSPGVRTLVSPRCRRASGSGSSRSASRRSAAAEGARRGGRRAARRVVARQRHRRAALRPAAAPRRRCSARTCSLAALLPLTLLAARRRAVGRGDGAARDPGRLLHRAAAGDPQRARRRRRAARDAHRGLHVADHRVRRRDRGRRGARRRAASRARAGGRRSSSRPCSRPAAPCWPSARRRTRRANVSRPRNLVRDICPIRSLSFTPQVREWFGRAFAAPTPAQAQAWPAIATGEHVLISAPTGSGKTLAAFLYGPGSLRRRADATSRRGSSTSRR